MNRTPDIGDIFVYRFGGQPTTFRVEGYIKAEYRPNNRVLFNKDGFVFRHCSKEDATHVSGYGVCGCIAPIGQICVFDRVTWTKEQIQQSYHFIKDLENRQEYIF